VKDYLTGKEKNMMTGEEKEILLPRSNVLQLFTEDGSKISVRPSGTEPKIKFYFGVRSELNNVDDFERVSDELEAKIEGVIKDLGV
jgi:phosphoglucomutase